MMQYTYGTGTLNVATRKIRRQDIPIMIKHVRKVGELPVVESLDDPFFLGVLFAEQLLALYEDNSVWQTSDDTDGTSSEEVKEPTQHEYIDVIEQKVDMD